MISYRKLAMRVLGHSPVSAVKTARRSTGKRAAALALTAALVVGMTLPAFALPWYIEDGDISISAGENGNNVTQGGTTTENDTDTVIKSKDSSTASSNTVTIDADEGKTVDVTLENVNIDTSDTGEAAVSVTGSGNTNIELNGNNTLTSGGWHAGLEHNKETDSEGNETSGTLTITDTDKNGSLAATGGNYGGAGIGGRNIENAGKIEITGGTITAVGAEDGAGIGGGGGGGGIGGDADITISGGTITAIGGQPENIFGIGGAGIGGGGYGGSADITITGDAVIKEAIGGNGAAGIGSGMGNPWTSEPLITVGNVTIEGNAKVDSVVGGANGAAGIGGGTFGIGNVIIRGNAQIGNATGGDEGAGIGGGVHGTGDVTIEGNVTIENAQGGAGAAGPLPVGDLGQIHAVRGDVLPVLDELVAHLLHGVGAAVAELGQALDDVDDEVEAVELIEHAHVKRRCDRALLDVAADEHVLVVAGVRQLVDELRVAVEGEDDGFVLREDEVVVLVREAVRVVGMRLQLHQVDHVHDAHAHLRQLLAQDGHGGQGL